ncbi:MULTISPECIES: PadR family transcriptional regulator [Microbacterium]|uniref:PadR family transcriptional regulator n=1 Tax=Microbacterium resistens TaxID=156977 RepID=A0ABY3RN23_9MICO|nr:PadR family transcriptional regulator [Microbacterium resistens]MBW1639955.1 PadR family transcriptional regulator [Microbacterium resistens]MDA4894357.1 PadR family transcriptional regulator [Streptomyces sp. MS2A]UGS25142.1 PadR family transcriptional regulator [Microbacterium resistens]
MSTTRLVVLGAVKQFQPVHGYFLRRELMTWHIDEWAHIQPGSIYNALRALEVDGYIAENDTVADGKRPARTTYRITPTGEVELQRMLRENLWNVAPFDTEAIMTVASFMFVLSRQEVIAGLENRLSKSDALITANGFHVQDTLRSETTPKYVREIFDLSTARLTAEKEWALALLDRLRAGEYVFAGETPAEASPAR